MYVNGKCKENWGYIMVYVYVIYISNKYRGIVYYIALMEAT